MSLLPVINLLRESQYEVTIHDCGKQDAKFCLAIMTSEPADLFYLGELLGDYSLGVAMVNDGLLYFPSTPINAEMYEYICAASQDAG
jgi:hypothetical protein